MSEIKVVLLGEADVGKVGIINKFMNPTFEPGLRDTLTSQFVKKTITLENNESVVFEIWDTAGQKEFRSLAKIFYKDARVIIFVFDITNKKSFDQIKNYWYEQTKHNTVKSDIIYVVVGNKCEYFEEKEVDLNEAEEFAQSINAIFALISTKFDNDGVQRLFKNIAKKIIDPNYDYKKEEEEKERYLREKLEKKKEKEKILLNKLQPKPKENCNIV